MKSLFAMLSLVVLNGCAVAPPGTPYYGTQAQAAFDPYQWHTVSSEPTALQRTVTRVEYTTEPLPVYVQQAPVYVEQPVYIPAPVYIEPYPYYYAPPVSIGLDFMFGSWGGGRHYGRYSGGRGGFSIGGAFRR